MCRRRSKPLRNLGQYAWKTPNPRAWQGDLASHQCESAKSHRQLGRDARAGQCGGGFPGTASTISAPSSVKPSEPPEPPAGLCGTSATRAPFASTRTPAPAAAPTSAPDSPAAITSTWSPGRNKRTVPASAIRTGADTNRAGRRARSGGAPVVRPAPAPYAALPPTPAPSPPSPVAASAAAVRASPAARARRCRHNARRSRCPLPPRTRRGSNAGTPQDGGADDEDDGDGEDAGDDEKDGEADEEDDEEEDDGMGAEDANMVDTTCCEDSWGVSDEHPSRSTVREIPAEACGQPRSCGQLRHPLTPQPSRPSR